MIYIMLSCAWAGANQHISLFLKAGIAPNNTNAKWKNSLEIEMNTGYY